MRHGSSLLFTIMSTLSCTICAWACIIGQFLRVIRARVTWKSHVIPIKNAGFHILLHSIPYMSPCVRYCSLREANYSGSHRTLSSNTCSGTVITLHTPGLIRLGGATPLWWSAAWRFLANSAHHGTYPARWHCSSGLTRLGDSTEITRSIGFQDCSNTKYYGPNLLSVITPALNYTFCV